MIQTSPLPPVTIPDHSLHEEIFGTLTEEDLHRPAITETHGGRTVTFAELAAMVDAFAGHLSDIGVRPGEIVALHCPNSIAFAVALHGALRAGAVVTTVGVLYTSGEIRDQLADSRATALITVHALGADAAEVARQCGLPAERIIHLDDSEHGLEARLAGASPPPEVTIDPARHLAVIPYSSGTTGRPKGVMLTHRNLVVNLRQAGAAFERNGKDRDDVNISPMPFFHAYGLSVILNGSLRLRNRLVIMASFDFEAFLRGIEEHRAEWAFVAPPILVALAKHPAVDSFDLDSLRMVLSGAATLDRGLARAVEKRIGVQVVQGYGLTEATAATHVTYLDDEERDVASIGRPLPDIECRIVDLEDPSHPDIPPPGEGATRTGPGELWLRGPQVMAGYLHDEEATAETLTPDGWLRTGDIVVADRHGNLYVVDRAKELIKYHGYQVAPAELEALLLSREDIADAAVVGRRRESDGEEIPHAFIVPAHGHRVDPEEVIAWAAGRVAPYKKIRGAELIDAIPKSAAGKILRRELRDR